MVVETICDVIIIIGSVVFIWSIYALLKQDDWEIERMIDEAAEKLFAADRAFRKWMKAQRYENK